MVNFYGQINFDELYEILKSQPELVKTVTFRNGKTARMVNVSVLSMRNADSFGNTVTIKVNPRSKKKEGANYYFGKFKEGEERPAAETEAQQEQPQQPVQEQDPLQGDKEDLPF